tara:strand:+ start:1076 stop:1717 length:642 start_codon:yes stop_codon:yes gene_type:complete
MSNGIEENIFEKNNYVVIKEAIPIELADFVKDYFLMKRKVTDTLRYTKIISPYVEYMGMWGDGQIPNTYAHYADIAMETLLKKLRPTMEKVTGRKLYENYSFARIYKYGDTLFRHKDRFSCEISTTLNLGGDPWPIYLDPTGGKGNEGVEVNLRPGDMLAYKGNILEHWRYAFTGTDCVQVFLHYNDVNTPGAEENKYDTRPFIGLPSCLRKK